MNPFFISFRRQALVAFLLVLSIGSNVARGEDASNSPPPQRELAIVISESISPRGDSSNTFTRIADNFERVFILRKWPLKITTERLAAGEQDRPLELKVFSMGVRQELPGEVDFRAWIILMVDGKKYDFGIIRARTMPRPTAQLDEILDSLYGDAAKTVAEKCEAVLFRAAPNAKGN